MTGRIEGKRSRGRRRVTWMTSVKEWQQDRGVKHQEVEHIEQDTENCGIESGVTQDP